MTQQPVQRPLPWIAEVLLDLKACLCDALETRGAGPVCWCGLWPGEEMPVEYCSECGRDRCGSAYVRVAQAFPSGTFPYADNEGRCTNPIAYEVAVGVFRCIPSAEQDGSLPEPGVFLGVSLDHLADAEAMRYAIECCLTKHKDVQHALGQFAPIGPAGGCVGGQWTVTLGR